jgi:hypothetical protein
MCEGPFFDNQVASLLIEGREATVRLDKTKPGAHHERTLDRTFERRLTRRGSSPSAAKAGAAAPSAP